MHDIINRAYGAFVAILRDEEVYMVRIKGKKFLAIAIAGAVFVGGVFPETACAAETAESTSDVQVEETKQQSVKSIQENLLEAYNTGLKALTVMAYTGGVTETGERTILHRKHMREIKSRRKTAEVIMWK